MLTPLTLPCHLTINQLENCEKADHISGRRLPHTAFKNALLKPTGEFGSFEHELPILFFRVMNATLSFTTTWCQWIDFTAHR